MNDVTTEATLRQPARGLGMEIADDSSLLRDMINAKFLLDSLSIYNDDLDDLILKTAGRLAANAQTNYDLPAA